MSVDLIIVGAGLSGLFAANLAADEGLSVVLVSQGRGGLGLSHGCIDIYNSASPSRSIQNLTDPHPYKTLAMDSIKASLQAFKTITSQAGLTYTGGISSSISLLSPGGNPFRTSLVPRSMIKGRLDDSQPITIAGVEHFRDFWAESLAANAKRSGVPIQSTITLPLLQIGSRRDLYATDIAKFFADGSTREEIWRAWKPKLAGTKRVGFPAIFGNLDTVTMIDEAEEYFGIELFEIPTLPPSLPGVRLEKVLRNRLSGFHVPVIEGPSVKGRIDGRSNGRLAAGIQIETAGGLRSIDSGAVLLATGGFLHGGLLASHEGKVAESVFGIPIPVEIPRSEWTSSGFWEPQPYARLGVRPDHLMRPLDLRRKPFLENVFAAGGIIGGADRALEGSRQGIDLGSAYLAIQSISAALN